MESKAGKATFTTYEKWVILLLTLTQFTVILDFMIMSPLGDTIMKTLKLSTQQFGWCVSGYAFSAGISGLLTAGFADKYDRKSCYCFFIVDLLLEHFFVLGVIPIINYWPQGLLQGYLVASLVLFLWQ